MNTNEKHSENGSDQLDQIKAQRDAAIQLLAEKNTLVSTLRGVITEQAQKIEDLERAAYQASIVKAQLAAALCVVDRKAEGGLCQMTHGGTRAFHTDIRIVVAEALTAAGVAL